MSHPRNKINKRCLRVYGQTRIDGSSCLQAIRWLRLLQGGYCCAAHQFHMACSPLVIEQRRTAEAPTDQLRVRSGQQQREHNHRVGPDCQDHLDAQPAQRPRPAADLLPLVLDETTTTMNTTWSADQHQHGVADGAEALEAARLVHLPTAREARPAPRRTPRPRPPTDIQNILNTRPDPTANEPPDPIFQTPAWLITEANLPLAKFKAWSRTSPLAARSTVFSRSATSRAAPGRWRGSMRSWT